ncbi:MAG: glycosyltransferase [Hyphomicrobiaceae bacterium]
MIVDRPLRAMWLLNHTTARAFEVPMLKRAGVQEVFLPKRFPDDARCRSASVDWSQDASLTIPAADLAVMNAADWYREPDAKAWAAANKHFDVLFFVLQEVELLASIARNFNGVALWRAFGLGDKQTYSRTLGSLVPGGKADVRRMGPRLAWATAYPHLGEVEDEFVRDLEIHLPLGLSDTTIADRWTGADRRLLFVCPDVSVSAYHRHIYETFSADFRGLPYAIVGPQRLPIRDPNMLGFLPREDYEGAMRRLRVMFYHSAEPYHLHYHPLEAVRAGMPLVFMGGGLLDRLGGVDLPGRAASIRQARAKVERILDGDQRFIDKVRSSQARLLGAMDPFHLEPAWRAGVDRIKAKVSQARKRRAYMAGAARTPRIAVLLAHEYRGGTLRGAKLVAEALACGARLVGQAAEIVFGHVENSKLYVEDDFADLPTSVVRRPFRWRKASQAEAARAATYAGTWLDASGPCVFPDDGINQFLDCDLWLLISDRIPEPLLALRPYVVLAYDYLQRHEPILTPESNAAFLDAARRAQRVWVTTQVSRQDAIQFAGVPSERVVLLPMLAPRFSAPRTGAARRGHPYFIWPTNRSRHKNHANAIKALQLYYDEFGGRLDCRVVGTDSGSIPAIEAAQFACARSRTVSGEQASPVVILGELPEGRYRALLAGAEFLWHPARRDNGTFCVVEAACLGVPALSSDYPAMREIEDTFALGLAWMDPASPLDMARQLKHMEQDSRDRRGQLPDRQSLAAASLENAAPRYWEAARACL